MRKERKKIGDREREKRERASTAERGETHVDQKGGKESMSQRTIIVASQWVHDKQQREGERERLRKEREETRRKREKERGCASTAEKDETRNDRERSFEKYCGIAPERYL